MNALVDSLSNIAYTLNGDLSYSSTGKANLDWFSMGSALRSRSENEVIKLFDAAFQEDSMVALMNLFHTRNIRGGQGERQTFRIVIKHLAKTQSELMTKLIPMIPHYGRWDDILVMVDTPVWDVASDYMKKQLLKDFANFKNGENISLMAKWLPSINTSSKQTKALAKNLAMRWFGKDKPYKQYRKLLAVLRKHIDIIEIKLCNKQYDFDYSKLPSNASLKYVKAFKRNDENRYTSFINDVKEGKVTVNTGTLYPYEIVRKCNDGEDNLDYLWDNLPNYCGDTHANVMVMADVSGSMSGTPMDMSISLALYFAERIKGDFNHTFMTFSSVPEFVKINKENTLAEKFKYIESANWQQSTDLRKAFELILKRAVANNVPKEDMPTIVLVISDMEFNIGVSRHTSSFEDIDKMYSDNGYERPLLVFWNVDSKKNTVPVMNKERVVLCSGSSPSTIKQILEGKFNTPVELMVQVLINSGMYQELINCLK